MKNMAVGESRRIRIKAGERWNSTGIEVSVGERYRFSAEGKWWDAYIRCSANGYESRWLRRYEERRRMPKEKWFALIGAVDREAEGFLIGCTRNWRCGRDGEILCYANDLDSMYWNNWWWIDLTVERLE